MKDEDGDEDGDEDEDEEKDQFARVNCNSL